MINSITSQLSSPAHRVFFCHLIQYARAEDAYSTKAPVSSSVFLEVHVCYAPFFVFFLWSLILNTVRYRYMLLFFYRLLKYWKMDIVKNWVFANFNIILSYILYRKKNFEIVFYGSMKWAFALFYSPSGV